MLNRICTVSGMVEYLLMVNAGKYTSPMDPIMKFGMYWLLIKDSSYCSKVVSPIYTYTSQATAGWPGKTSPRNLPGPLALIPRACISFTRRFFADQPQKNTHLAWVKNQGWVGLMERKLWCSCWLFGWWCVFVFSMDVTSFETVVEIEM